MGKQDESSDHVSRQHDLPDYASPTARPYTAPASVPEQASTTPPDPRSPVRQLLDMFELDVDEERAAALDANLAAIIPSLDAGTMNAQVQEAVHDYEESRSQADSTSDASGADVHVSAARVPFPNWSLSPKNFPPEFDIPVRIPLTEVVAGTVPQVPPRLNLDEDDDGNADGDDGELLTRERTFEEEIAEICADYDYAEAKAEHAEWVRKGVDERIEKIQKARALMPFIPEGKSAGMLQKVSYRTVVGGSATDDTGWMFVEPSKSEYGKWFADRLKLHYDDAKAQAKPAKTSTKGNDPRLAMWAASAAIAIAEQEAAPSGINTYDARVLSWGVGLAAPGLLQKVMWEIVKDPKIRKTFYCCGFSYGCDIRTVKDSPNQYHGIYQIVDVKRKEVVYGDNFYHRNVLAPSGKVLHKKGELQGNSFLALRAFTAQRELLHMLVQVARDPETRETVFKHNYDFVIANVTVQNSHLMFTEALYVFVAQVQHNWGHSMGSVVEDAVRNMSRDEEQKPPSLERDRAIARAVVRRIAKVLQEERFKNAVKAVRTGKYPKGLGEKSQVWQFPAKTEWGPKRMYTAYWKALQTGQHARDQTRVVDDDFLVPNVEVPPGHYRWVEPDSSMWFDLGLPTDAKLLLNNDDFRVVSAVGAHRIEIKRFNRRKETWSDSEYMDVSF